MPPNTDPPPTTPPGEDEQDDPFETLVWAALDSLPDAFRDRLNTVAIAIEDEPTADDLARTRAPGLLGLYTGVPRTFYGASEAAVPSKITIYRGPHVRILSAAFSMRAVNARQVSPSRKGARSGGPPRRSISTPARTASS